MPHYSWLWVPLLQLGLFTDKTQMPYIHWETDLAQTHVAEWIEEVRLDSEKTSGAQENNFWPSEKNRLEPNPTIDFAEP